MEQLGHASSDCLMEDWGLVLERPHQVLLSGLRVRQQRERASVRPQLLLTSRRSDKGSVMAVQW